MHSDVVIPVTHSGRIEVYVHSDATTPHKGAAVVRLTSQTDFAARTDPFIGFAKRSAMLAYASKAQTWDDICAAFPEMTAERAQLQSTLRETVEVFVESVVTL